VLPQFSLLAVFRLTTVSGVAVSWWLWQGHKWPSFYASASHWLTFGVIVGLLVRENYRHSRAGAELWLSVLVLASAAGTIRELIVSLCTVFYLNENVLLFVHTLIAWHFATPLLMGIATCWLLNGSPFVRFSARFWLMVTLVTTNVALLHGIFGWLFGTYSWSLPPLDYWT